MKYRYTFYYDHDGVRVNIDKIEREERFSDAELSALFTTYDSRYNRMIYVEFTDLTIEETKKEDLGSILDDMISKLKGNAS